MSNLSKIALILSLCFISKNGFSIDFLNCISDVPINDYIIEKTDTSFLFDSDAGRIVSVEALSNQKKIDIEAFYKVILNQFGWTISNKSNSQVLLFIRDEEILKINIKKINNSNIITYSSFLSLKIN